MMSSRELPISQMPPRMATKSAAIPSEDQFAIPKLGDKVVDYKDK